MSCFVICEAGVNHNGDVALAKRLIEVAREAGADAVKFQTFKAEKLASEAAPLADYQAAGGVKDSHVEMLRKLELDEAAHRELLEHCRRAGIEFMSTPFDEESADMLERLGMGRFKVPSGELTNRALVRHVARKGKPMIVSTGMSTLDEVRQAVGWVKESGAPPLTLLHCVTEYPAPPAEINLRAMDTMREAFSLPVGYSDHTLGLEVALAAAARGASLLEKHLTLDRSLPGPDHAASLEPADFARLVSGVRLIASALGDGVKRPAPCEARNRDAARRSLVALRDLPAGHTLSAADVAAKRPGHGIAPAELDRALGRVLKRAVRRDEVLTWELL